jgi:predicted secreted protein
MYTTFRLSIAWLLLVIFISGCAPAPAAAAPREIKLTEQDNGSSVEMQIGDRLVITLPGNVTTGYNWEAQPPADGTVLKQVGEPEVQAETNKVGSGGQITLTFEAVSTGQTPLTLVYHRSWEKNVPPQATFSVKVTVS